MSKNGMLSRRGFLQGAATSAIAFAGAGALTGCSNDSRKTSESDTSSISWDKEADIIVVGTGTATFGALAALDYGAQTVIVLEKAATFGGTSRLSGGGYAVPLTHLAKNAGFIDSKDNVITYYQNASDHRINLEVAESFIDHGDEWVTWTEESLGWDWMPPYDVLVDYYEPDEGWTKGGNGCLIPLTHNGVPFVEEQTTSSAGAQFEVLEQECSSRGIEVLLDTPAVKLIRNGEGKVVGVQAESKGKDLYVKANACVLLGTGGFDWNDEMRRQNLPFPLFYTVAPPSLTGDGHLMGAEIGAQLAYMDKCFGMPYLAKAGDDPDELFASWTIQGRMLGEIFSRLLPNQIIVNRAGKRFGDEATSYDVFNRNFGQFDSGSVSLANIPAFFICDDDYRTYYGLPMEGTGGIGDPEASEIPETFVRADTLEELAEKLGIDPKGLLEEVEQFNADAVKGVDPKFHRGEKFYSGHHNEVGSTPRPELANNCLGPIEKPPFYGATMLPGTIGTSGGLKVNGNAQVLDMHDNPIEGLYACGNCSAGATSGVYMHGGMTLGSGAVMGFVAVRHALGAQD